MKQNPSPGVWLGIGIGVVAAFGVYLVATEAQPKPRRRKRKKKVVEEEPEAEVDASPPPPPPPRVIVVAPQPPEEEGEPVEEEPVEEEPVEEEPVEDETPEDEPTGDPAEEPAAEPEQEPPSVEDEWKEIVDVLKVKHTDLHSTGEARSGPFTGQIRVYRFQNGFVGAVVGASPDGVFGDLTEVNQDPREAWQEALDRAGVLRDQLYPEGAGQPPDFVDGPNPVQHKSRLQT